MVITAQLYHWQFVVIVIVTVKHNVHGAILPLPLQRVHPHHLIEYTLCSEKTPPYIFFYISVENA